MKLSNEGSAVSTEKVTATAVYVLRVGSWGFFEELRMELYEKTREWLRSTDRGRYLRSARMGDCIQCFERF